MDTVPKVIPSPFDIDEDIIYAPPHVPPRIHTQDRVFQTHLAQMLLAKKQK
jgi:hypothetical protein